MGISALWHRLVLLASQTVGLLASLARRTVDWGERYPDREVYAEVTFRAAVDAVVPETPELGDELGAEHVPGGLDVDLDEFVVEYVDRGFQFGLPAVGPSGNLALAGPIANVLDVAALRLLARGENEDDPSVDRAVELLERGDAPASKVEAVAGTFSKLSRRDRLRAIAILDDLEPVIRPTEDALFEIDGGLVGQLVVGFTELIYYSEWEGYDEFVQPPSQRDHPNDPEAVQSWRQTGYPGFADGYAALRGYLGTDEGSLGDGETWATIDGGGDRAVKILHEPGSFRENDYDTSDYEEPYPENAGERGELRPSG